MLAGIIIKTYTTISQVSFRLQQEKEIAKEALVLSQVLDNLAQSTTIDYDQYKSSDLDLVATNGIVDTLYLSGDTGKYQISSINTCLTDQELYEQAEKSEPKTKNQKEEAPCQLLLTTTQDWKTTHLLLDGKNFKLSKMQFKIIPFIWKEDLKKNLASETPKDWKPAFWILGTLYSHYYNPNKWTNNISLPLQFFFSLQGKTESLYSIIDENATQSSEA